MKQIQVNVDDMLAALKGQRNEALDQAAMLAARVSTLEGQLDSLTQQLEQLKKAGAEP